MVDEYYKLREVILGLRGEYQKNQEKLNELKKYAGIYDKRVSDIDFWVFMGYENPVLCCTHTVKRNRLQQAYWNRFGIRGLEISDVYRDYRNHYLIDGYYKSGVNNHEKFHECATDIMSSDFVNNIQVKFRGEINDGNYNFDMRGNYIGYHDDYAGFGYDSKYDQIYLNVYDKNKSYIDKDYVEKLLEVPIPIEKLPQYHRDIIEQSNSAKKMTCVQDCPLIEENSCYLIYESPDQVVLKKVKNR